MFLKLMANSKCIRHEYDLDLDSLAPTCAGLSNYWQVDWNRSLHVQRHGIYMRPLFTLTPGGSAHFNCVIVLQGDIILLDTWHEPEISTHTALALAFHTVRDGFHSTLRGIRVQLHRQGRTKRCWSILFLYMARLVRFLRADSNTQDVLDILSSTKVIDEKSNFPYFMIIFFS